MSKISTYIKDLKKRISLYLLPSRKYFQQEGLVWGTSYKIIYEARKDLGAEILETFKTIDTSLSVFNHNSLISRINRNETQQVDRHFQYLFQIAKHISVLSNGFYDPTVKPLLDLWSQYAVSFKTPSIQEIRKTQALIGINECSITNGYIKKKCNETQFDFSSLAKGYGVDCIGSLFQSHNIRNYMIEVGGECLAKGINPDKRVWRVRLDIPTEHDCFHIPDGCCDLFDTAIATAGNYRSYFMSPDGVIGHIVNPISGYPINTNIISATVFAKNCVIADALSTACFIMGLESLKIIQETFPFAKIVIYHKKIDND